MPGEGEGRVDDEGALVLAEAHLIFHAVGEGAARVDDELKLVGRKLLVVQVKVDQAVSGFGEGGEVGGEGDAGEGAFEVVGEFGAVLGVVEECVDVVEDVPFGDGGVLVVVLEGFECEVGDVFAAVGAIESREARTESL